MPTGSFPQWKAKASAQEGHEAIRPVDFAVESVGSNENERKLYELIRMRALASQLADATYATRKVQLRALDGQPVNGKVPGNPTGKGRGAKGAK